MELLKLGKKELNFHDIFQFEEFCSEKSSPDTTVAAEPEYPTVWNSGLAIAAKAFY